MFKNTIILLCVAFLSISCSKTVKGPVTGEKYKVKIGGWSDMDKYKEAREEAIKPSNSIEPVEKSQECNVVDCPESVREGRTY